MMATCSLTNQPFGQHSSTGQYNADSQLPVKHISLLTVLTLETNVVVVR